jgi:hypothetical protein
MTRSTMAGGAAVILWLAAGTAAAQDTIKVTIRFVPGGTASGAPPCVGVTSSPTLTVRSGQMIKWKLKKDDDHPCEQFDADQVTLRFGSDQIVSEDGTNGSQEVKGHRGVIFHGASADAKVIVVTINTNKYPYDVLFGGKLAADPELEVTGGGVPPKKQ